MLGLLNSEKDRIVPCHKNRKSKIVIYTTETNTNNKSTHVSVDKKSIPQIYEKQKSKIAFIYSIKMEMF